MLFSNVSLLFSCLFVRFPWNQFKLVRESLEAPGHEVMGSATSIPLSPTIGVLSSFGSLQCPHDDYKLYNSGKEIYRLYCGMGFSGADLGWSGATSLLDCVDQCDSLPGCGATVYIGSTSACHFNGVDAKQKPVPGAQGAILDRVAKQIPLSNTIPELTTSTTLIPQVTTTVFPSTATKSSQTNPLDPLVTISESTKDRQLASLTLKKPSASNSATTFSSKRPLTILALGDSITEGYIAHGAHNSYRLALMNMLLNNTPLWNVDLDSRPGALYRQVNAVGSVRAGNFSQARCEGHPAKQIEYIHETWSNNSADYPQTPDVLLLMAGINDIAQNATDDSTLQAVKRLRSFVDDLNTAYPEATLIVSTLTPTLIEGWKPQVDLFNSVLPAVLRKRIVSGKKILLVDMFSALTTSDLADWVHPSAEGYTKMAKAFFRGIEIARLKGWLR